MRNTTRVPHPIDRQVPIGEKSKAWASPLTLIAFGAVSFTPNTPARLMPSGISTGTSIRRSRPPSVIVISSTAPVFLAGQGFPNAIATARKLAARGSTRAKIFVSSLLLHIGDRTHYPLASRCDAKLDASRISPAIYDSAVLTPDESSWFHDLPPVARAQRGAGTCLGE